MSRQATPAQTAGHAFWQNLEEAGRFFMGDASVQKALEKLVRTLDAQAVPYAIVGAMALNEFGYRRVTVDIDILLTPEGLAAFKAANLGRGYVEKFPGSRGLRDPEHGVDIDVVRVDTRVTACPSPWRSPIRRRLPSTHRASRSFRFGC
jgi:hypothetical protein